MIAFVLFSTVLSFSIRNRPVKIFQNSVIDFLSLSEVENQDIHFKKAWKSFLVEFRGGYPNFRIDEFLDCAVCLMDAKDVKSLTFHRLIADVQSDVPICVTVKLPSCDVATNLARRSSTIRSISEFCGVGDDPSDLSREVFFKFDDIILPYLASARNDAARSSNDTDDSWRFTFRRYGRFGNSGLDAKDKVVFLREFSRVITRLGGPVNLTDPKHNFLYLEDCSNYQAFMSSNAVDPTALNLDTSVTYRPKKCFLGRVVGEGPSISSIYSLKQRPFIGTTSMDAVSAHLTANAALVSCDMLVLDPFCGTGSLLVACAVLGADVVGADIDGECLGLVSNDSIPYLQRSKNVRFRRKGQVSQMEENILSNFQHYGLAARLAARMGIDASQWLDQDLFIPWETSYVKKERRVFQEGKLLQVDESHYFTLLVVFDIYMTIKLV